MMAVNAIASAPQKVTRTIGLLDALVIPGTGLVRVAKGTFETGPKVPIEVDRAHAELD